jgi:hypothetical protein
MQGFLKNFLKIIFTFQAVFLTPLCHKNKKVRKRWSSEEKQLFSSQKAI